MKPFKLLIHSSGKSYGGVERYILLFLRYLDSERFQPTLMHEPSEALKPWLEEVEAMGVPTVALKISTLPQSLKAPSIARWIRDNDFDIMHSHLEQRYMSVAAAMARLKAVFWTYHVRIPDLKFYQRALNRLSLSVANGTVITVSEAIRKHLLECGYPAS